MGASNVKLILVALITATDRYNIHFQVNYLSNNIHKERFFGMCMYLSLLQNLLNKRLKSTNLFLIYLPPSV